MSEEEEYSTTLSGRRDGNGNDNDYYNTHFISHDNHEENDDYHRHHSTMTPSTAASSSSSFMNSFQWPFINSSEEQSIKRKSISTTEPVSPPPSRIRNTSTATTPTAPSPSSLRWAVEASTTETISHGSGGGSSGGDTHKFSRHRGGSAGAGAGGGGRNSYALSQQRLRPSPLQSLLETTTTTAAATAMTGPSSTQSAPPGISSLMSFGSKPIVPTTTARRPRTFSSSSPNSFDESSTNAREITPLVQKFQYLEHNASTRQHHGGGGAHLLSFQLPFASNQNNNAGRDPPTSKSSSIVATMIQNESSSDTYRNHSTASMLCGFGVAWIFWVTIWILLLAEIMRIHNHRHHEEDDGINALLSDPATMKPWARLDRIYFATSVFWSVGGMASTGTGAAAAGAAGGCVGGSILSPDQSTLLLPHSNPERWVICGFLLLSLGFWSLALGQWGNAVIEAHTAASMAQVQAQERLRREEEQRKYHKEQRRRKLRYQSQRQGQRPSGITLALMQSERELAAQTNPAAAGGSTVQHYGDFPEDQFDVEDEADTSMFDNESSMQSGTSTEFQMFPGLPWLLVQSIFCTALMIFWVVGIQYYEQRGQTDDVNPTTQEALINHIASTTGHPPTEVAATLTTASDNAWNAVSTIYYAVTTAYTVGLGDVTPVTRNGKILGVFFIPLAVGTAIHWIVWMAQCFLQRTQRNKVSRRDVKLRLDEFYESRLVSMGLVDDATFASLKKEYEMMPAS